MDRRIKCFILIFLLGFGAILGKLFNWQILNHRALSALAGYQYKTSIEVPSPRGRIYSSDNFPLVLNQKSFLFFVDPQELNISAEQLREEIGPAIGREDWDLEAISNKKIRFLPLSKNLSEEEKGKIEDLKIKGLGFLETEKRFYPEASMSAHLLGFVGEGENGGAKGYFGLEGYYDQEIAGQPGLRYFEKDALGRPIPLAEELIEKPIPGRDLFLNIDRKLQFLVENHLKSGLEKYSASSGLVLIMNPQNGAVLAMASFPNYNPALYYEYNSELYRDPVISSSFEPGSIFKVLVMAAALDSGAVKKDDVCLTCSGPRKISDYLIKTWNEKYFPNSTMTDIIIHSDNVGMVYVGEKLGVKKFYDYLDKFGFGKKTDIDLQGEISPALRSLDDWREIDLATASFGQGIAITPIQFLTAICVIANQGELYQPLVVRKLLDNLGSIEIKPIKKRRVISPSTAQQVTQMMVQAVEKGEAKWARPKNYQIAGKTGTAQIPIAGHYDPEKTIASFVGFAPPDKPAFAMLVSLKEPKSSPWGSETAAPLWFDIAKDIFRLWHIQPSSEQP